MTPEQIASRVAELGPWFHNLDLRGVRTAPDHFLGDYPQVKWRRFAHAIPADLTGRSVLDIGCNGGFYAIEMKRRGAATVVAIDTDETYLAQARFAAEVCEAEIDFRRLSVYNVGELERKFDLVLFMGVLYHLRHPLLALDLLRRCAVGGEMVFQTLMRGSRRTPDVADDYAFADSAPFDDPGFPRLHFIEKSYSNDPTNWWFPNLACAEAMLRSAGFEIVARPEDEVLVCRATGPVDPFAEEELAWLKR